MLRTQQFYPVSLSIDYPDRARNRLAAFFRMIIVIPIFIVLALFFILGSSSYWSSSSEENLLKWGYSGFVILPTLLMILLRRKYPAWWFAWNLHLVKFCLRVLAYLLLLRDEYPSTDQEQAVHVQIAYPNASQDLNRWLPLIKWILALPHYIVLALLFIIVLLVTLIAWFSILFTKKYPRDMFGFVTGTLRWNLRVLAYAFLLTTDRYPPFKLEG